MLLLSEATPVARVNLTFIPVLNSTEDKRRNFPTVPIVRPTSLSERYGVARLGQRTRESDTASLSIGGNKSWW